MLDVVEGVESGLGAVGDFPVAEIEACWGRDPVWVGWKVIGGWIADAQGVGALGDVLVAWYALLKLWIHIPKSMERKLSVSSRAAIFLALVSLDFLV